VQVIINKHLLCLKKENDDIDICICTKKVEQTKSSQEYIYVITLNYLQEIIESNYKSPLFKRRTIIARLSSLGPGRNAFEALATLMQEVGFF